jgi:hypothetical protein
LQTAPRAQVDEDTPMVAVPMDLPIEPTTKLGYWFVSLSITDTNTRASASNKVAAHYAEVESAPAAEQAGALDQLISSAGDVFPVTASEGVTVSVQMARSASSYAHHAVLATRERAIVEAVVDVNAEACAAGVERTAAAWEAAGAGEWLVGPVERCERGNRALLLLRRVPMRCMQSLRSAMHGGVRTCPLCQRF